LKVYAAVQIVIEKYFVNENLYDKVESIAVNERIPYHEKRLVISATAYLPYKIYYLSQKLSYEILQ